MVNVNKAVSIVIMEFTKKILSRQYDYWETLSKRWVIFYYEILAPFPTKCGILVYELIGFNSSQLFRSLIAEKCFYVYKKQAWNVINDCDCIIKGLCL